MAFDFMDMLGNVASARVNQAMQPFTNTDAYATNRLYNAFGMQNPDQTGNVQPKSTTINNGDDGTHEVVNTYTVSPTDYSLTNRAPQAQPQAPMGPQAQQPGAGLGAGFTQYLAPQAQQPQAQPQLQAQPQYGEDQSAAETARLMQQQQLAQGVPTAPVPQTRSLQPVMPTAQPQTAAYTGAGMFPAGAQPIQTNTAAPDYFNAILKNETGGLPNPNAAVGAAGERGAAQVLPSTSRDPGYGVKPAANNTPEEMNRVGRDYYTAMKDRYHDPVLAAAAYNGGPGRMDAAIARAQAEGGHPMQYMPTSTQQYASKFAQTIGYKPGQTAETNSAIDRPWENPAPGLHMPGHEVEKELDRVNAASNNPEELHKIVYDPSTPKMVAKEALNHLAGYYEAEKAKDSANSLLDQMVQGDPKAAAKVTRELTGKSEEGSYIKAYFLARFGLTDLAKDEMDKIAGGTTTTAYIDGKQVAVTVDRRGNIKSGADENGQALTPAQINKIQATGMLGTENLKTLQTQAHHSSATAMDAMRKENIALENMNRPPKYSEQEIIKRGRDTYNQTMNVTRPGFGGVGTAATTGTVTAPAGTVGAKIEQAATKPGESRVLGAWDQQRPGENAKALGKRLEMRPEDIEEAAQALVKGQIKTTELSGRSNDFRRLAIERALEIDPKYTSQRYGQVDAVVKRYTSGKDHDTLVNTGTAVNHLMQFKDIAAQTPGNTNTSSWNTFYQNLMKYGNAPEIKSKEAMAGFVAGELVKAASGGHGSMTERIHLEQQLMKANTPAEVAAIVDNSIKLAHGRYISMKKSYEGATGRTDFDEISGMPDEAKAAFSRLEKQDLVKKIPALPSQDAVQAEIERRKKANQ